MRVQLKVLRVMEPDAVGTEGDGDLERGEGVWEPDPETLSGV